MKQILVLFSAALFLSATPLPDPFAGTWAFQGNNGKNVEVYVEIVRKSGGRYAILFIDNNPVSKSRKEFSGLMKGECILVKTPNADYLFYAPEGSRMKTEILIHGSPGVIKSEYVRK